MIIATDLDDTLLNSKREISEFNKKAFYEAKKQGHKIAILTLRSVTRSIKFAKEIGADFICAFLGNLIYDTNNDKILFERSFEEVDFKTLVDECKDIVGSWIGFETENKSCINDNKMLEIYDNVSFVEPSELASELEKQKVFKLSFGLEKQKELISEFEKIAKKHNFDLIISRKLNFVDFFVKNTDKVNALQWLKQNMPNEKIIMFGDSEPDAESLKFADIGVAVANATEGAKKSADFITETNDEDGVGKYVLKLLNNNN